MAQLQQKPRPSELTSEQKHLHELLSHFSTVLLGTFEQMGVSASLRARPMSVAKLDPDCTMYFVSAIDARQTEEADRAEDAHVFGQSSTRFFTLRGRIFVSPDRAVLRSVWHKLNDVWFEGPDDPRAVLLVFRPEEAELWDSSGIHGVRFLFDAARALITGDRSHARDHEREQHQRLGAITVSRYTSGGNAD
ncbi:MAG TPA: pyridoxamine 5'-phosphate oxidase family protein [Polyangiales bacterium]|jgi:general stress protein 26|nr:pyridoxamine 5'-phosphate oxidase family protein [Polyangiales bacterium]